MPKYNLHKAERGLTFRELVRECAQEPAIVEAFNRHHGARLEAPIAALLQDRWPLDVKTQDEVDLGAFIVFIHEALWQRMKRV